MKNKRNNYIFTKILIEHEDKDGFLAKGNKFIEVPTYINADYISYVTSPISDEYYLYNNDGYHLKKLTIFKVKLVGQENHFYLLEKEFNKFEKIMKVEN